MTFWQGLPCIEAVLLPKQRLMSKTRLPSPRSHPNLVGLICGARSFALRAGARHVDTRLAVRGRLCGPRNRPHEGHCLGVLATKPCLSAGLE
jgi:hypothetical protein